MAPAYLYLTDKSKANASKIIPLSSRGGTQDDAMVALQQLGLLADAQDHGTLYNGAIMVFEDTWKYLASINPTPYGDLPAAGMRIRREDWKRTLLQGAEQSKATWMWAYECTTPKVLANGQIKVATRNMETRNTLKQSCELLIAADGPESRIRANMKPHDMKISHDRINFGHSTGLKRMVYKYGMAAIRFVVVTMAKK